MDWFIDALKDSAMLIPTLFIAYVLIEVLETATSKKLNNNRFLLGKWAPATGAVFGMIPQCGFSVVATDLYSRGKITVGTLIAIFIATSDEALPILLGNLTSARVLYLILGLIAVKLIVGVISGYLVDFIASKFSKNKPLTAQTIALSEQSVVSKNMQTVATASTDAEIVEEFADNHDHDHEHEENELKETTIHKGCCGHDIEEDHIHPAKQYVLHPLIHTLKVFAYIFVVNVLLGLAIHYIGEDRLADFLLVNRYFAPLLASIVGLIPNCASSVVLTNLCVTGTLSFSACVAGLIINAGIAYLVLFKQNKNKKTNFAIVGTMFVIGLATGYILMAFGI